MRDRRLGGWLVGLLFGVGLMASARPAEAAVTYFVTVNTSSVNGTSGFLDFQFNPGNVTTQAATATISNFKGGMLAAAPAITGNVSGMLPGTVMFGNSTALNDYFQKVTYGAAFSFQLTLSGPALDTPNGTATAGTIFGVGLNDSTPDPILTNQGGTTGFAGEVDINLDGTTTPTTFPNGSSPSVVSIVVPAAAAAPAMSMPALAGSALLLAGLGSFLARKRQTH
jgi:hypothetical protein